jgi:hypothetical protein
VQVSRPSVPSSQRFATAPVIGLSSKNPNRSLIVAPLNPALAVA